MEDDYEKTGKGKNSSSAVCSNDGAKQRCNSYGRRNFGGAAIEPEKQQEEAAAYEEAEVGSKVRTLVDADPDGDGVLEFCAGKDSVGDKYRWDGFKSTLTLSDGFSAKGIVYDKDVYNNSNFTVAVNGNCAINGDGDKVVLKCYDYITFSGDGVLNITGKIVNRNDSHIGVAIYGVEIIAQAIDGDVFETYVYSMAVPDSYGFEIGDDSESAQRMDHYEAGKYLHIARSDKLKAMPAKEAAKVYLGGNLLTPNSCPQGMTYDEVNSKLTLNGVAFEYVDVYKGENPKGEKCSFFIEGDINIELIGNNTINNDIVADGNIKLSGNGALLSENDTYLNAHNLDITNCTVSNREIGCAGGKISASDATINNGGLYVGNIELHNTQLKRLECGGFEQINMSGGSISDTRIVANYATFKNVTIDDDDIWAGILAERNLSIVDSSIKDTQISAGNVHIDSTNTSNVSLVVAGNLELVESNAQLYELWLCSTYRYSDIYSVGTYFDYDEKSMLISGSEVTIGTDTQDGEFYIPQDVDVTLTAGTKLSSYVGIAGYGEYSSLPVIKKDDNIILVAGDSLEDLVIRDKAYYMSTSSYDMTDFLFDKDGNYVGKTNGTHRPWSYKYVFFTDAASAQKLVADSEELRKKNSSSSEKGGSSSSAAQSASKDNSSSSAAQSASKEKVTLKGNVKAGDKAIVYEIEGDATIVGSLTYSYTPGSKQKLNTTATRPGYTFAGWYDKATNKKASIKKKTDSDITVYAKWKPCKYTVEVYAAKTDAKPKAKIKLTLDTVKSIKPIKAKKLGKEPTDTILFVTEKGTEITNGFAQNEFESKVKSEIVWTANGKKQAGVIKLYIK